MMSVWSPWRWYRKKEGNRPLQILRRFECNLLEVSSFKIMEMQAGLLFDYFQPKILNITWWRHFWNLNLWEDLTLRKTLKFFWHQFQNLPKIYFFPWQKKSTALFFWMKEGHGKVLILRGCVLEFRTYSRNFYIDQKLSKIGFFRFFL